MKARPILFSGPMVRALLDGSKTQTRRIIKPQPEIKHGMVYLPKFNVGFNPDYLSGKLKIEGIETPALNYPYGKPGDLLWVREAWSIATRAADLIKVYYKAHERCSHTEFHEFIPVEKIGNQQPTWPRFKPSIHMPRAMSRITLEITGMRVERLQDISHEDALAEGAPVPDGAYTRKDSFMLLWRSINGAESWAENPWVWVMTFRVHRQNIDEFLKARAA